MSRVVRHRVRPSVIQHESTLSVMSSGFGVEETDRRAISVHKFEVEPTYVRINAGVTKNLGNYESFRMDVSLSVPCYSEETAEVVERVSDEVSRILESELEKYNVK